MHAERYVITSEAAAAINAAERLLAVGTTSVRVLESAASPNGKLDAAGKLDRHFHLSAVSISRGRSTADEFPSSALDFAHAGECVCRAAN